MGGQAVRSFRTKITSIGAGIALAAVTSASVLADEVDPRFRAMAHIQLGLYGEACQILDAAYPAGTQDVDVLFLRGQCLAGQHKLEPARKSYERVLELDPDAHQVRAELATIYHAQGNAEKARATYAQVLDAEPPADVRSNIERAMQALRGDKRWYALASVGGIFDSNVRSGPDNREITAFGLPFTLSDASLEDEAFGMSVSVLGGYAHPIDQNWQVSFQGSYARRDYEQGGFDTDTLSIAAGPVFSDGSFSLALLPRATGQYFGGELYRTSYGADTNFNFQFAYSLYTEVSVGAQKQNYYTVSGRDGWLTYGYAGLGVAIAAGRLSTGYQVRNEEADLETNTNFSHGPRVSYRGGGATLAYTLAYQFTRSEYREVEPAFGVTRRDDTHAVDAKVRLGVFPRRLSGLSVDLGYGYYDNRSTLDINTYDRHISTLGLSKRW